MDNEIGELIDELNKLKLHNPSAYRKRLMEIKATDPYSYNQISEIFGLGGRKIRPVKGKVFSMPKSKKKEDEGHGLIVIGAVALVGLFITIMIIIFIGSTTLGQETTSVNPINAINLGHALMFNSSTPKYLYFTINNNITTRRFDEISTVFEDGREYVGYNKDRIVSGKIYLSSSCEYHDCVVTSGGAEQEIIVKEGNSIVRGDLQTTLTNPANALPSTTLVYYDELKHIVQNELYDTINTYEVGYVGDVRCAPIRLYLSTQPNTVFIPQGAVFKEMVVETCISNEGIPIALGRYVSYEIGSTTYEELFLAEYVTNDETLIGLTSINEKTIMEWFASP